MEYNVSRTLSHGDNAPRTPLPGDNTPRTPSSGDSAERTLSPGDNARVITCSLLGDGMVGKTCLVHSYTSGYFKSRYVATVSDQYTVLLLKQEEEIFLNIHDTAGQSDFEKFRTSTYMDSEVLILCFSVCDIESFSSISSFWLPEIKHNSERKQPIILVGTQTDMRSGDTTKEVTRAEGQRMAKLIGAETYVECSARRRADLDLVFESVIEAAFRRRKRKESILRTFLVPEITGAMNLRFVTDLSDNRF